MVSLRPWNKNDTQQLLVLKVLLKQKDYMRETTRQLCLTHGRKAQSSRRGYKPRRGRDDRKRGRSSRALKKWDSRAPSDLPFVIYLVGLGRKALVGLIKSMNYDFCVTFRDVYNVFW